MPQVAIWAFFPRMGLALRGAIYLRTSDNKRLLVSLLHSCFTFDPSACLILDYAGCPSLWEGEHHLSGSSGGY